MEDKDVMNILADRHQSDLWWSLDLLTKRLGGKLYCPYGISWFEQGYYRLYEHPRKKDPARWLAKQYLEDVFYDFDGETGVSIETVNGCLDYPRFNLLTLEKAKETPIDIVICTVHENEQYFAKLKEFYPKAKFIRQVGNQLDTNINDVLYPNLLSSATAPFDVFKKHKVKYPQEFDLNIFKSKRISAFNNIYSFQNDLEEDEEAWSIWLSLRHEMRNFNFKSYGVGNVDGKIFSKRKYVERMLDSTFIFQRKFAEGYGHVVFNALCLGRIMVLNADVYTKNMAASLLEDEVTCLFLEDTPQKTAEKILRNVDRVTLMSNNARNRFNEVVDFDKSFLDVKYFFENLI